MSQVYERDRKEAESDYYHLALQIRIEVNRLMASSSVVPKAYRLLNAVPTVETARSIVYNINRAYQFYPSSSFNVLERRRYLTLAVADCEQLLLDIQCLIEMGVVAERIGRFERLTEMVRAEIGKLKAKRKNTVLLGKSAEERIRAAREEIERLEQL